MAFYKVTKKQEGGGGGTTKDVAYLKWQITKTRDVPAGGYLQVAEFYLYQNGEKYTWDSNVSITSDMTGNTDQEVSKLIDGNTGTKYCTPDWGSVQTNECNIVISLGETITLDAHSTYSYVTGDDESSRDPISWKLFGSTDGTTWELLDERTDATVPTDRYRETISFPMSNVGGDGGSPIYSLDQSQGGQWINSNIDTSNLTKLNFTYSESGEDIWTRIVNVSDIAVYTGGSDVYTVIFGAAMIGRDFNARIYNNELYVSYNGTGPNTKVVSIYNTAT